MSNIINKSELIQNIASRCESIPDAKVEPAVREIIEILADSLAQDDRVEIRGFGTFSLHHRPKRQARNPKTGEVLKVDATAIPHFKPGKALREAVDDKWM